MRCKPTNQMGCVPGHARKDATLSTLVRIYRVRNRESAKNERTFFASQPSLELAIHHAALASDARGKRFSHQCRIPRAALSKAKSKLTASSDAIQGCRRFHDLHVLISERLSKTVGLGELYKYDTAHRIGAFLGLTPSYIYLHAGTRTGARMLGLKSSRGFLEPKQLPAEIQTLSPEEIEDFLCIYKRDLAGLSQSDRKSKGA